MREINVIRVLYNPHFRNLWLSQLISQIFLNTLVFSQLLRVYDLTKSNIAVSILVLTIGIPNLALGALAGVLVDRWDKKAVMFACQAARVVAIIAFIISSESVLWIYTLMLVVSSITQFWAPAEVSTIPRLIKGPLLLSANGVYTLTFFSTVIIGNVLAGPILAVFGSTQSYLLIAFAFMVATMFIVRLPGARIFSLIKKGLGSSFAPVNRSFIPRLKLEFSQGLRFIQENPKISHAIGFLALSQTMIASLSVMAPGFSDRVLHISIVDVSFLVMLPAALGMLVGALAIGQFFWHFNKDLMVHSGLIASGTALVLLSYLPVISLWLTVPLTLVGFVVLVCLGLCNALVDIPSNTILQEQSTPEVRSRVYGVLTALVGLAAVFPVVVVGTLSDLLGVEKVMLVLGVVVILFGLYNRVTEKNV